MLPRGGRGQRWVDFPTPGPLLGGKPPPDSTAILTKTGGADVRHTKQRTGRARTFTNTRERRRAQGRSYTRQDPGAARAQGHARTHTGAGDDPGWAHDCRRRGHASGGRAPPGEGR